MKKISIIVLVLFVLLCSVPVAEHYALAEKNSNEFDNTYVLDDLNSSSSFNVFDYPFNLLGNLKVINFVEYCYSYYEKDNLNYGLYVYLYNPQKALINLTGANKIQLACTFDADGNATDYVKYDLKFCSKSDDSIFYKFKIVEKVVYGKTLYQRVDKLARKYEISGIELSVGENKNIIDYPIAGKYHFTGYAQGLGQNKQNASTLDCVVSDMEVIELNVKDTIFRTQSSSLGADHQNQLNSVYFSVPNYYFDTYGDLQRIKAEWYEYKTSPIVITNHGLLYNYLKGREARFTTAVANKDNYPYSLAANLFWDTYNVFYDWGYMLPEKVSGNSFIPASHFTFFNGNSTLGAVFYSGLTSPKNYTLPSSELIKYFENVGRNPYDIITINNRTYNKFLFDNQVDSGRSKGYNLVEIDAKNLINLLSYDDTNNWFQKFLDYGLKPPTTLNDTYKDLLPICVIDEKDLSLTTSEFSKKYLVNTDNVSDIKKTSTDASKTVLFRFANTDYYSSQLAVFNCEVWDKDIDAYMAQQTMFFDFDIIQLTFYKEGLYHTIAAVSSPIDIIGDITSPIHWDENGFPQWVKWLMIGVLVVFLVILILVLKVLLNPFKLLFKSKKKDDR